MTLSRGTKFLLILSVAALVIGALVGNPSGLLAGAPPQKAETTLEDCATCHEDVAKAFGKTSHVTLEKSTKLKVANPCESCHGPGKAHIEGGGDKSKIIGFKDKANKTYNRQCLECHTKDHALSGFYASTHAKQGLDCADCHSAHKAVALTSSLKARTSSLCMDCHTQQKTQFAKPFHHRVKEKAMECTDCHQPHSSMNPRQTRTSYAGEEVCVRCHTEKQGPFVFEHPALNLRGCQGCHEPHGSNNTKLLVRANMASLCLECHSRSLASKSVLASQPPAFHNQNLATYRNCTTCHVMIHGSNFDRMFLK